MGWSHHRAYQSANSRLAVRVACDVPVKPCSQLASSGGGETRRSMDRSSSTPRMSDSPRRSWATGQSDRAAMPALTAPRKLPPTADRWREPRTSKDPRSNSSASTVTGCPDDCLTLNLHAPITLCRLCGRLRDRDLRNLAGVVELRLGQPRPHHHGVAIRGLPVGTHHRTCAREVTASASASSSAASAPADASIPTTISRSAVMDRPSSGAGCGRHTFLGLAVPS